MPLDYLQTTVDATKDVISRPLCYGVTRPLFQWFGACTSPVQTSYIPPAAIVSVTPAAPNTIADMTSGLWSPEEMWRQTRIKNALARLQQQKDLSGGGVVSLFDNTPEGNELQTSDYILIGGLVIAGLVAVKAILR